MSERRLKKSLGDPQETRGRPWKPGLYISQKLSDVRTSHSWSVCRPTPVHAGTPIVPARAFFHRKISATGALKNPLLHQGSRPTWVKTSRRTKKPPRPSIRPIPPFVFHQDALSFSPNVFLRWYDWPALPVHANTAHANLELTKTAAPDPTALAAVGSSKINPNHAKNNGMSNCVTQSAQKPR